MTKHKEVKPAVLLILELKWNQITETETQCTLEPRSLKMISTSKILPNCCKESKETVFKSLHIFSLSHNLFFFLVSCSLLTEMWKNQPELSQISEMSRMSDIVVLTPNICLRSGSLNLKGMLETWSLLGWALLSVLSDTLCVGGWLSVWAASSVCWNTQRRTQMKEFTFKRSVTLCICLPYP